MSELVVDKITNTEMKKKVTYGFVVQTFDDDGKCVEQEFIAGDQVEWECAYSGDACDSIDGSYQDIKLQQP